MTGDVNSINSVRGDVGFLATSRSNLVVLPIMEELKNTNLKIQRYKTLSELLSDNDKLSKIEVLVANSGPTIDRDVLGSMPRLRALISPTAGMNGFDFPAATQLGVAIGNSAVAENYESMTEATVLMILSALYDLPGTMAQMAPDAPDILLRRSMLGGKTVGLISYGNIAKSLAKRLANWNVDILVSAPRLREELPPGARRVELSELMAASDVICVLCSLNDETRGMLDAKLLNSMKPHAMLVNMARGEIIDEEALIACARRRPDIKLALDAFAVEPLPSSSGLRALPNAILTPHKIGHTLESIESVKVAAIENIRRVLTGQLPNPLRNPEVEAAWKAKWGANG